ncbi:MAG: RES domain-containing protein [Deltaproteobacteria bacterium]|nr:MAG: RES domain-containing protein [Deltaproteobacteria bacterium]
MSPNIWTRCGGTCNLRRYRGEAWRVVESQQLVGTRKWVDSEDEHELLEALIDAAKPPAPRGGAFDRLHFLLAAPFRYPPLKYGSRFGKRTERGIWYGAEAIRTALAEVAYYRLLFLEGTSADLPPLMVELTAFVAALGTERAADLTAPPFDAFEEVISSPTDYAAAQALGSAMRADRVVLARYRSARDAGGGACVAVLSPEGFARPHPYGFKQWFCVADRRGVEMTRKDFLERGRYTFWRDQFLVDGRLPAPAT